MRDYDKYSMDMDYRVGTRHTKSDVIRGMAQELNNLDSNFKIRMENCTNFLPSDDFNLEVIAGFAMPDWYHEAKKEADYKSDIYALKDKDGDVDKYIVYAVCSVSELRHESTEFKEFIFSCLEKIEDEPTVDIRGVLLVYIDKDKPIETEEYLNTHLKMYDNNWLIGKKSKYSKNDSALCSVPAKLESLNYHLCFGGIKKEVYIYRTCELHGYKSLRKRIRELLEIEKLETEGESNETIHQR